MAKKTGEAAKSGLGGKSVASTVEARAHQVVSRELPARPGVSAESSRPVDPAVRAGADISHAEIAQRAYDLYAAGAPGTEFDHWMQAERELRGA